MSGVNIFLTILSACGTICAIIFGYIAYKRNGKNDNKDEGKKDGVVLTELGYTKQEIEEMKKNHEI